MLKGLLGGGEKAKEGDVAAAGGAGGGPRASLADVLSERLDVESQLRGNLWKKDTAGSSSWKLRFFVIKDGFLLYYPEQTTATMTFDMHPKGVVPLDGVEIETVRTGPKPGLTSAVRLTHPSFGTKSMILCARDDAERDKWVTALSASSYITYARAVAAAAELEAIKQESRELRARIAAADAQLARKNEQVIKLVAQNKGLLASITAAEKAHGITIEVAVGAGAAGRPSTFGGSPLVDEGSADGADSGSGSGGAAAMPPPPPVAGTKLPDGTVLPPPPPMPDALSLLSRNFHSRTPSEAGVAAAAAAAAAASLPPPPPPAGALPPPPPL